MNDQRIEFVTHKKHSNVVQLKDRFEFRPDRPAHWLQGVCLWTLRKLKAYARDNEITYTRHVIEPKNFMDALYKQRSELFHHFGKEGARLLIGSEDFADLMNQPMIDNSFEFRAQYMRNGPEGQQACGLTIEIIPWMRGILVMP